MRAELCGAPLARVLRALGGRAGFSPRGTGEITKGPLAPGRMVGVGAQRAAPDSARADSSHEGI